MKPKGHFEINWPLGCAVFAGPALGLPSYNVFFQPNADQTHLDQWHQYYRSHNENFHLGHQTFLAFSYGLFHSYGQKKSLDCNMLFDIENNQKFFVLCPTYFQSNVLMEPNWMELIKKYPFFLDFLSTQLIPFLVLLTLYAFKISNNCFNNLRFFYLCSFDTRTDAPLLCLLRVPL